MKELRIKPIGGIGNRLLVMDSAIRNRFPVKPTIIWERNRNLNCAFKELFHLPDEINLIETSGFQRFAPRTYFELYNAFDPSSFRWSFFNKLFGKEKEYDLIMYDEELSKKLEADKHFLPVAEGKVYLAYHGRFGPISNSIFPFKPLNYISEEAEMTSEKFSEKTIGIHIRRTDHRLAINHSPIEEFIKMIERQIEKNDTDFFLATDDFQVKKELTKTFGNRIHTRNGELNRNSLQGVKNALIDMYCLSHTKEIIGSYDSTFSQVSAELGGIKNHPIFMNSTAVPC